MSSRTLEAAANQRFTVLAEALGTRLEPIVGLVLAQARREIPPEWFADRPELDGYLRETANQSILAELRAFQDGARLPETCPSVDAEFARRSGPTRRAAHQPALGLQGGPRRSVADLVRARRGAGPRGARAASSSSVVQRFFFAYANRLSDFVTRSHRTSASEHCATTSNGGFSWSASCLMAARSSAALDYAIDAYHVGVIGWGPDAVDAVRELAGLLRRRLLIVSLLEDTWWAWLGADRALDDGGRQALRRYRPRSRALRSGARARRWRASGALITTPASRTGRVCVARRRSRSTSRSPWKRWPAKTNRRPPPSWPRSSPGSRGRMNALASCGRRCRPTSPPLTMRRQTAIRADRQKPLTGGRTTAWATGYGEAGRDRDGAPARSYLGPPSSAAERDGSGRSSATGE